MRGGGGGGGEGRKGGCSECVLRFFICALPLHTLFPHVHLPGADRTLVFVETKRNADFLASFLSQEDFPTTSIHG